LPCLRIGNIFTSNIGTSNFYVDLLRHEDVYAYSQEKWDFGEALKDVKGYRAAIEMVAVQEIFSRN